MEQKLIVILVIGLVSQFFVAYMAVRDIRISRENEQLRKEKEALLIERSFLRIAVGTYRHRDELEQHEHE